MIQRARDFFFRRLNAATFLSRAFLGTVMSFRMRLSKFRNCSSFGAVVLSTAALYVLRWRQ